MSKQCSHCGKLYEILNKSNFIKEFELIFLEDGY